MGIITSIIAFPMIIAVILLLSKGDKARSILASAATVIMTGAAVAVIVLYFASGEKFFGLNSEVMSYIVMALEALMAIVILYIGLKHKKYLVSFFVLVQTAVLIGFELIKGHGIKIEHNLYVDRLSMILMVVTAVVGGIISIYAVRYMKKFHEKNPEVKDRRSVFFFSMYMSMGSMMGLLVSNNVIWMYLFWEVMALTVYYMVGYTGTEKAQNSALKSLALNMLGGLCFVAGILVLGSIFGTLEFNTTILIGSVYGDVVAIPALFMSLTGLIMSVQMPFAGWFVKMDGYAAPAAAMISAVTAANAGVFIIIKFAPILGADNFAGITIMIVGGITFIAAAFASIAETNIWKVMGYSTMIILGLAAACGGLGSAEAVWAAVMLLIFHAFAKALMLLCAGNAEVNSESEVGGDMRMIFADKAKSAACMLAGVAVLFITVMEMLLLRWTAVTSFADSGNIIIMAIICFGCGAVICCMGKWMGILSLTAAKGNCDGDEEKINGAVKALIIISVLLCIVFPLISVFGVMPYLEIAFGGMSAAISISDIITGVIMIVFVGLMAGAFYGKKKYAVLESSADVHGMRAVSASGIGEYFAEKKPVFVGSIVSAIMLIIGIGFMIGTLVSLLGGAA